LFYTELFVNKKNARKSSSWHGGVVYFHDFFIKNIILFIDINFVFNKLSIC